MVKGNVLPVVALKGMSILPGMIIHFDVNRDITIKAVEEAMKQDQMIFLVLQKDNDTEAPKEEDLYRVGTLAQIKQMIKLPGDILRVMVEGLQRAILKEMVSGMPYLQAEIAVSEEEESGLSDVEQSAMIRGLKDILEVYGIENPKIGKTVVPQLLKIKDMAKLVNQTAIGIPFLLEEKQRILEAVTVLERYHVIAGILAEEIEILRIKKEFQQKVKEKVDKNQKEYLLREQLKVIREELGETNTEADADSYNEQLKKLKASKQVKEKIKKEIDRLLSIGSSSAESAVTRGYIELLLELPWDKTGKDNEDIKHAEKVLNEDHYGLEKVKERILEYLAARKLAGKGSSPILCLVGPPGTGKTSIAKSVARALNKKYVRICLGGVRDEAEIRGHRKTYVGAMPGRIASGLKNAGVKNPLFLLDEIDKAGSDHRGDTSSALLEVLDSEQNNKFIDHYVEIPLDLSEVLFIATANSLQSIQKPLLDRMEVIEVNSYTENEKLHIAREHLIEKQKVQYGLSKKQLTITQKAMQLLINGYTREAGVRNLERKIGEICRKTARAIVEKEAECLKITDKNLSKYLGNIKYTTEEACKEDQIGVVRGLAWTSVGGETLEIEVNVMPGKGSFELTGQLGDVMKESAKTAISFIRSISSQYEIEKEFFEKNDIHIHIPEGAVPKDGPSAGITMATAILSAITGKKVKASAAMTGEITLRGRVLPIGGLKEKLLAAKAVKIKQVLVPKKNKKDVEEMSDEILDGLEIKYVETMNDVIKWAFV